MAADVSEPDAPFGNEPPGKPEFGPEYGGGFPSVRSRSIPGVMGAIAPPSIGRLTVKQELTFSRR